LTDWTEILLDIDQRLFPHFQLNAYERCLYYHLISQTHVRGQNEATIPLQEIVEALNISVSSARKAIRSLANKGIINLTQTRKGHFVSPKLPAQFELPRRADEGVGKLDIEEIDFYSDRRYLSALMEREGGKCFYCLRDITEESCELDHVVSQLHGGSNDYRNVAATCHSCNTRKQESAADNFLRLLLRRGLLSEDEFSNRLNALERLKDGELVPQL
jgi:5-methylcytosine-specific restriction endonuclease McrA